MTDKYTYGKSFNIKKLFRIFSFSILLGSAALAAYIFFPLLSWQLYFAPVFASQDISYPIPKTTVVGNNEFSSLITSASNLLSGVDYTNAQNWYPNFKLQGGKLNVPEYSISIPSLKIENAKVSTTDNDLAKHLVNYGGSQIPPNKGNVVIFGHSTLPQLFDPKDYKTIFANAYKMKAGDEIFAQVSGVTYKYKVFNIKVVEASDTSVLNQNLEDSFLTLITCTPPGTVWKRLIIKARMEKI